MLVLDTEEFKKYSSAEFLINVLLNEPQKSEYFREKTVKGLRNNYFYVADITQNSLQDINADDNGAYKQIRNTSTMFHYKGDKVHTVYRNGEELYYNRKVSYNRYEKVHVSVEEVVTLHRRYCKAKSFPLKRIVMTINPIDGPIIPYVAVLYQIDSPITEDKRTLCHGNSKENESRPYIRTSKKVLSKTKDFLQEGNTCKGAYDKVNALSGGVYESSSQSDELRNMKQVTNKKKK